MADVDMLMNKRRIIKISHYSIFRRRAILRGLLKVYIRLLKIRGESQEIALGLALGLFIGMLPTLGAQMVLAVVLAALFKGSKIAAALGVWFTNPLTGPFIYGFNYWIGAKLLGLHTLSGINFEASFGATIEALKKAPEILGALTLGGVISGLPVALLGYWLALRAVRKYQTDLKIKLQRKRERLRLQRMRVQPAKMSRRQRLKNKLAADNTTP